jgi:hypothetical protein
LMSGLGQLLPVRGYAHVRPFGAEERTGRAGGEHLSFLAFVVNLARDLMGGELEVQPACALTIRPTAVLLRGSFGNERVQ